MITKKLILCNPSGLHMRSAGIFVKTAEAFSSQVELLANGNEYNCKSILSILSACINCEDQFELRISGVDEQACMSALVAAVEAGLGE